MNPSNLNAWIKHGLKFAFPKYTERHQHSILVAPYLLLDSDWDETISKEDAEAIQLLSPDGLIRTPFPTFRYCFKYKEQSMFGFIERKEGELLALIFYHDDCGTDPSFWKICFLENTNPFNGILEYADSDTQMFSTKKGYNITQRALQAYNKDEPPPSPLRDLSVDDIKGMEKEKAYALLKEHDHYVQEIKHSLKLVDHLIKFHNVLQNPVVKVGGDTRLRNYPRNECFDGTAIAIYCLFLSASYEIFAPYNFMAAVHPNREHKSVEWREAHTHYTIIHRHHPANKIELKHGAEVQDTNKQLTRMAHSRRAHTRLLKSAKFKHMQGQRIFIRASWVGPQIWKDKGGKQIYRII